MANAEMQQRTIRTVDEMRKAEREAFNRIVDELVELAKTDYMVYQCQARGCSFDAAMTESYEEIKQFGENLGKVAAERFMMAQQADPIFVGR